MAEGHGLHLGYFMAGFDDSGMELSEHKAYRKSDIPLKFDRDHASFDCVSKDDRLVAQVVHKEAGSEIDSSTYNVVDGVVSTNYKKNNTTGDGCRLNCQYQ